MPVARVLLRQSDAVYRFLKFDTSSDGSLLAFLDRDPRPRIEAMTMSENGTFVPDEVAAVVTVPSAKFSIHTTGEVHRYAGGQRQSTIYIEPLHSLTKITPIAFFSIPQVAKLDGFEEAKHRNDAVAILEIPEHVSERLTFVLELGPQPQQPVTFGVALNYEIYSAVVRLVPNFLNLPTEMVDHFIHGMPVKGQFDKRQTDKATAELGFHQRIHGQASLVFREDSGAYVLLAEGPMLRAPQLTITFDKPDLRIELIPFDQVTRPTHKVRFWICDKGGRNRTSDLRNQIKSIELSAEL